MCYFELCGFCPFGSVKEVQVESFVLTKNNSIFKERRRMPCCRWRECDIIFALFNIFSIINEML